jgi:hypothetical protein
MTLLEQREYIQNIIYRDFYRLIEENQELKYSTEK